jgi:hypothetical protein
VGEDSETAERGAEAVTTGTSDEKGA